MINNKIEQPTIKAEIFFILSKRVQANSKIIHHYESVEKFKYDRAYIDVFYAIFLLEKPRESVQLSDWLDRLVFDEVM